VNIVQPRQKPCPVVVAGRWQQVKNQKMKIFLLINILIITGGCTQNKSDVWYTHMINPKHLPIEFEDDLGEKYIIETGNYVELKSSLKDNWTIKTMIDGEIKTGQIPRNSKTGNPTIVYLKKFDEKIHQEKSFCSEVQLKPQKALTLRTRPLTDIELREMRENRSSQKSRKINNETAIFGIQHGVKFKLLDDNFGTWQKIKVQTKNQEFIGFINKKVKEMPTRKNNCD
jgi:hypothetical protein